MNCPECGATLKGDEVVCPNCLTRLTAVQQAGQAPSATVYEASPGETALPGKKKKARMSRRTLRTILLAALGVAVVVMGTLIYVTRFRKDGNYYFREGEQAYYHQQYETALAAYLQAAELMPDQPLVQSRIGWCYYHLEQDAAAIPYLRRAVELDPQHSDAYLGLGKAYYYLRQYTESASYLQKAIELDPNLAEAYGYLGTVTFWQEDYETAISLLKQAVTLNPTDADSLEFLGRAYYELDRPDEALEPLRKALEMKPSDLQVQ
ncbi:MAG TPA: tetratricopeptide repeat protein, partial [Anaerolineae bacterium]|nr:tetratricopeptide repeat protein [Anaerolineae bacterium]